MAGRRDREWFNADRGLAFLGSEWNTRHDIPGAAESNGVLLPTALNGTSFGAGDFCYVAEMIVSATATPPPDTAAGVWTQGFTNGGSGTFVSIETGLGVRYAHAWKILTNADPGTRVRNQPSNAGTNTRRLSVCRAFLANRPIQTVTASALAAQFSGDDPADLVINGGLILPSTTDWDAAIVLGATLSNFSTTPGGLISFAPVKGTEYFAYTSASRTRAVEAGNHGTSVIGDVFHNDYSRAEGNNPASTTFSMTNVGEYNLIIGGNFKFT